MDDFVGQSIRFFDLDKVYFGNLETDINFCNLESHYYMIKDGILPDLNKTQSNNVTLYLESNTPHALRDIQLNLTIIPMGMLNIHYTYANSSGVEQRPF